MMASRNQSRIMYIERKAGNLTGAARIGRVSFSKTGKMLYYRDLSFHRIQGFKANYREADSGEEYWISGPHKDGNDALYKTNNRTEIDLDVQHEYWTAIRKKPEMVNEKSALQPRG